MTRKALKKALAACVTRSATGNCPIAQKCIAQFTNSVDNIAKRR
jgi:hypothetical protein